MFANEMLPAEAKTFRKRIRVTELKDCNTENMVEVFKTNVQSREKADAMLALLSQLFSEYACNFDLDDTDRIFRVKAPCEIDVAHVTELFTQLGLSIEILHDEVPMQKLLPVQEQS